MAQDGTTSSEPRSAQRDMVSAAMQNFEQEKLDHKELAEHELGLMHELVAKLSVSGTLPTSQEQQEGATATPDDILSARIETMENILKSEHDKLTFEEKERAAFDVHGFQPLGETTQEASVLTPEEFEKLKEMDAELLQLGVDPGRINPLIQDRDYRLLFLRCDDMDVKVAAQRIKRNLDVKRELFGEDYLHREIELSDLNELDLQALQSGFSSVSPHKDPSGRTVIFLKPQAKLDQIPLIHTQRSQFFAISQAARLPSYSQEGIVMIVLHVGHPSSGSPNFRGEHQNMMHQRVLEMRHVRAAVPKKLLAFHYCVAEDHCAASSGSSSFGPRNDPATQKLKHMFFTAVQLMVPSRARHRFRKHYGTKKRIEFELGAFGITLEPEDWPDIPYSAASGSQENTTPPDAMDPMDIPDPTPVQEMDWIDPALLAGMDAFMDLDAIPTNFPAIITRTDSVGSASSLGTTSDADDMDTPIATDIAWITSSDVQEDSSPNSIVPTDMDVLFGRGKKTMYHAGNLYMRDLVDAHRAEYEAANKPKKTVVAQRIVDTIAQSGRRFLKYEPEEDRWVLADAQTARNKISHIYRNTRNKDKKKNAKA